MSLTFPGESAQYRAARDRLLEQEIELRRAMEAVAAARRGLPPGGPVPEDYVFEQRDTDGTTAEVRFSELFAPGKDSLVIYNFMFPRSYGGDRPGPSSGQTALLPLEEGPCPSCVALLDQLDGAAEHASQWINLAVVAKAPLSRLDTWVGERGWRHLRLLSSAANNYNRDYFGKTGGRFADADAQRIPARRRDHPPLLGRGAHLRANGPWAGSPQRRHPRAALEPVRPDARGAPRLGRAAELLMKARRDCSTRTSKRQKPAPPEFGRVVTDRDELVGALALEPGRT